MFIYVKHTQKASFLKKNMFLKKKKTMFLKKKKTCFLRKKNMFLKKKKHIFLSVFMSRVNMSPLGVYF